MLQSETLGSYNTNREYQHPVTVDALCNTLQAVLIREAVDPERVIDFGHHFVGIPNKASEVHGNLREQLQTQASALETVTVLALGNSAAL